MVHSAELTLELHQKQIISIHVSLLLLHSASDRNVFPLLGKIQSRMEQLFPEIEITTMTVFWGGHVQFFVFSGERGVGRSGRGEVLDLRIWEFTNPICGSLEQPFD